jgi:hypothetical protein
MRSRGYLEITMLGSSSWMSCAPQGVKGLDDDDDDDDYERWPVRRADNLPTLMCRLS